MANKTLIQILSTGRTGTTFLWHLMASHGVATFGRGNFEGEPKAAVRSKFLALAEMWSQDPASYFNAPSDVVRPYLQSVRRRMPWWKRPRVVVDRRFHMTVAAPFIDEEARRLGIEVKYVILVRNPIKTIHALYCCERHEWALRRPLSFYQGDTPVQQAANVWRSTYRLIDAQRRYLGAGRFYLLNMERLLSDRSEAARLFAFMRVPFNRDRFTRLTSQAGQAPLRGRSTARADSSNDIRHSHLYRDPDFQFSTGDLSAILTTIGDVLPLLEFEAAVVAAAYRSFHAKEKHRLGFHHSAGVSTG